MTDDDTETYDDTHESDDPPLWEELPGDDDAEDAVPTGIVVEDDYVDLVTRDAMARELLREDGFGHVGELWDRDPREDYQPQRKPEPQVREVCLLCAWPLNLPHPYRKCEFPYQPGSWWRDDRPAYCHCNGCLCAPTNRHGRPEKFCIECKHRIKLARERAFRRAEGAQSWSFDADADRIADYEIAFRALAASRSDNYPRW